MRNPTGATLTTFQVGFGDCFLLSIHYAHEQRHVLVDFGTTSMPRSPKRSLYDIAKLIKEQCGGKLHAIVASHRHSDHIAGFAGRAGTIITSLAPELVLQPWTEDPDAARNAREPTRVFSDRARGFVGSLEDMQGVAAHALTELERFTESQRFGVSKTVRDQLGFLGETGIKNKKAINTLMDLDCEHVYAHHGSNSGLEALLPGVKVHVLGPPTLEQSDEISEQRHEHPEEFWHLQLQTGKRTASQKAALFPKAATVQRDDLPYEIRWYLPRLEKIRGEQLLQIVRALDEALNNTSLILLFEIGKTKLLFPGDAQIESWQYVFKRAKRSRRLTALLEDVHVYKVGHHGSLNATPKTLWGMLAHKGDEDTPARLRSILSTKTGKHGSPARGTEVPRTKLKRALEKESELFSTQSLRSRPFWSVELPV